MIANYSEYLQPLIDWLHHNPNWAGFITFIISFAESLAIVGTIVPGTVTMTAIGLLVGSGVIPLLSTFFWAVLGAVLGDNASYWLGHVYREQIVEYWPFSRYPRLIENGKHFFTKHGGKSVFLGRFFGPLRAIVPVIAGMMHMSHIRFFIANVTSGFLWSVLYIFPGVVLGAATQVLTAEEASRFLFYSVIALVGIWGIYTLLKHLLYYCTEHLHRQIEAFWQWLHQHPRLECYTRLIAEDDKPTSAIQFLYLCTAMLLLVLFTCLALNVKSHGFFTHINQGTLYLFLSLRSSVLDPFFTIITISADKTVLLPFACLTSFYLWRQQQYREGTHLFSLAVITAIAIKLVKSSVHYVRPKMALLATTSYAFPSGHTALALALIPFITFILYRQSRSAFKAYLWMPCVCYCLLVMLSRLYLGMHWLTDILGGLLLSLSLLCFHLLSLRRHPSAKPKSTKQGLLILSLFLTLSVTATAITYTYKKDINGLQQIVTHSTVSQWWGEPSPPILVRRDRLGHVAQALNVQWLGRLSDIRQSLTRAGFKPLEKTSLNHVLLFLIKPDQSNRQPLLQPLYKHQRPSLMMIKDNIRLTLWPSLVVLSEDTPPLWYGAIFTQRWEEKKKSFNHLRRIHYSNLPNPGQLFSALTNFQLKRTSAGLFLRPKKP